MPGGDRTGPLGLGPMTGRAAGYCAGYPVPGFANPWGGRFGWWGGRGGGWGRGRGGGWGRGRGSGYGYYAMGFPGGSMPGYVPGVPPYPSYGGYPMSPYGQPPSPEEETEFLKDQAQGLQEQLEEINKRIQELATKAKSKK